jgi:hypothetical protein
MEAADRHSSGRRGVTQDWVAVLPRPPHALWQEQIPPDGDQRVTIQEGGEFLRANRFPEHDLVHSPQYGVPLTVLSPDPNGWSYV